VDVGVGVGVDVGVGVGVDVGVGVGVVVGVEVVFCASASTPVSFVWSFAGANPAQLPTTWIRFGSSSVPTDSWSTRRPSVVPPAANETTRTATQTA
jgi:hypothetical protein